MYKNIYYDKDKQNIHIWDDVSGHIKFKYKPYHYVKSKTKTPYTYFLDGSYVKKVNGRGYGKDDVYEADVNPLTRTLVDRYYNSDEVSKGTVSLFFDIEVLKTEDGYSKPDEANGIINSLSYYDDKSKIYVVNLLVDPNDEVVSKSTDEYELRVFYTEVDLLKDFIDSVANIRPDIMFGWNSDYFDIPYLLNRCDNVGLDRYKKRLSPIGIVDIDGYDYTIAGVSCLDYMLLYKKFSYGESSSYKLEYISNAELGRGKIEYDGSLDDLYREDIDKFVLYNYTDVELMVSLEDKLQYIQLTKNICHKGHVPYSDVYMSSRYLEGASLVFFKKAGIVSCNKPPRISYNSSRMSLKGTRLIYVDNLYENTPPKGFLKIQRTKSSHFIVEYSKYEDGAFHLVDGLEHNVYTTHLITPYLQGAFVKFPVMGRHEWVYDIDLTSLYPSIIRTLNISPETKIGKILNFKTSEFVNKIQKTYILAINEKRYKLSVKQLYKLIETKNYAIAANGVLYRQDIRGFIPKILDVWFNERKEYKGLMKQHGKAGDIALMEFYDLMQLTVKTLLNSFYGALALGGFRFNDIDNAEAVTLTGQQIIKFSANSANVAYKRILGLKDIKNFVIYTDTDSLFCSTMPFFDKFEPNLNIHYDVTYDDSLKSIKFNKDVSSWKGVYSDWIKEYLKCAKDNNFIPMDSEICWDTFMIKSKTSDIQVEFYKLAIYLKKFISPKTAAEEMKVIDKCIFYAKKVQTFINKSYDMYAKKMHNMYGTHYLDIKQEYVAKSAFWVAKKRYAQWMVDKEGIPKSEMQVKGLDVVRSSFPNACKTLMSNVLTDILFNKSESDITNRIIEFKDNMKSQNYKDIMSKSSVNDSVDASIMNYKGLPAHVKASINHNKLMEIFKSTEEPIKKSDKIQWTYLNQNDYGFKVIALKGYNDEEKIIEFVKKNIDHTAVFESSLRKKLDAFYEALGWGKMMLNKVSLDHDLFGF